MLVGRRCKRPPPQPMSRRETGDKKCGRNPNLVSTTPARMSRHNHKTYVVGSRQLMNETQSSSAEPAAPEVAKLGVALPVMFPSPFDSDKNPELVTGMYREGQESLVLHSTRHWVGRAGTTVHAHTITSHCLSQERLSTTQCRQFCKHYTGDFIQWEVGLMAAIL